MYIKNLNVIDKKVNRYLKRSNSPKIALMLKHFRPLFDVSDFGDYPLLAHLIYLAKLNFSRDFSRKQIGNAVNSSEELKGLKKVEKTELINNLLSM